MGGLRLSLYAAMAYFFFIVIKKETFMSRFSKIFAEDTEETIDIKPVYQHLDGTIEVLGFESFGYGVESLQLPSAEENTGLRDSIEADIVLLETIASQQNLTQQQDAGTSTPNYDGLNVVRQKTELSEDAKKFYQEEGLDYRKISAEGFVDKVKEIWHWIVEKIKKWWDALFGGPSVTVSFEIVKSSKKGLETLKASDTKSKAEKISASIAEGDEQATAEFKQSLQKFDINRWAGLLLREINKPIDKGIDILDIEKPLELHLERIEKFCRLLDAIGKSVDNYLIPLANDFIAGTFKEEEAENQFKSLWTHFKEYFKPLAEVEGNVYKVHVADWTRSLILTSKDDFTQSVQNKTDKELRQTLKDNLDEDYDEMVKVFTKIGKDQMVRRFEGFVRLAENLVATTQKVQDNFKGYGKRLADLKDKMNKDLPDSNEAQLKIQGQFVRYAVDVITVAHYANNELNFIETFTAALINFCTGYVDIEAGNGGAIVDPHVDWKKKG